jgi:hypothetical protein
MQEHTESYDYHRLAFTVPITLPTVHQHAMHHMQDLWHWQGHVQRKYYNTNALLKNADVEFRSLHLHSVHWAPTT